jgi:hypothetical protein
MSEENTTEPFGSRDRVRVRVERSMAWNEFRLFAIEGKGETARLAVGVKVSPFQYGIDQGPLLSFDDEAAQKLLDDLWQAGIRPSEGALGRDLGELVSVREHLDDMRRLVFASVKIDEPSRQRNVR